MNVVVRTDIDGVAVLAVDNPPVNAFSARVRAQLAEALLQAERDDAVRALVVRGAGATFMAGADIKELGTAHAQAEPDLRALIERFERCAKPVVAAIHGTALGGGLEFALAARARVAAPGAKLGLPEIKLGILPGAGGTQRLPRLIGPEAALDLMLSGEPIGAARAAELGAIDAIAEDVQAEAVKLAGAMAAEERPHTPLLLRRDKLTRVDKAYFETRRAKAAARGRGATAPAAIVDCVEAACLLSPEAGMAFERERLRELLAGEQRRALTHLFFAEREARKVPGLAAGAPAHIRRVGVVGAGTMGGGIAMALANAGLDVTLSDANEAGLARGLELIERNYAISVERGAMAAANAAAARSRIAGAVGLGGFDEADYIIEAAPEDLALKRALFGELDRVAPAHAILASNTSSLDIDALGASTQRPGQVLGAHFFAPANVMKLLEVVRGTATSLDAIAATMELGRRIGKVCVLARNCDGFIGNRMLQYYTGSAEFLAERGVPCERIDAIAEQFGMPIGPMAMRDMSGIDVGVLIRNARRRTLGPEERMSGVLEALHAAGRLGMKNGKGFYRYEGRKRLPDPEAAAIVADAARRAGIEPRAFRDEEIRDRLFFPLVNEGAKELEDGTAMRAGDIDVAWVNGYGFPAHRGGPMFWGRSVGLAKVARMAEQLGEEFGPRWRAAPLLLRLAESGADWPQYEADGGR